jgi:hypothetical protein
VSYQRDEYKEHGFISAGLSYHRPLSLRWQLDFTASLRLYIEQDVDTNCVDCQVVRQDINTRSFIAVGVARYIISSRSDVEFSSLYRLDDNGQRTYRYGQPSNPDGWTITRDFSDKTTAISLGITGTYRVAIPTEITASAWAFYRDQTRTDSKTYSHEDSNESYEISLGVSHYLF